VPLAGLAVSGADAFSTPLGRVEVDDEARRRVLALPQVSVDDVAHEREHSLEVQLPFLQRVLASFRLLPLAVGAARASEVAAVLDVVWGGPETVVVVSSDLSHYHDYATAARLDRRTAAAIVAVRPDAVAAEDACGAHAVRGLLEAVHRRRLRIDLLDLRSSGDTSCDLERVVGYGAFAVT
jgi:MEMO1 family protein